MTRPFVRFLLHVSVLPAALWFLHRTGESVSGALSLTDPTLAAIAVLRYAALALGWYLAAATAIGAGARMARVRPLVRAADRLTPPPVRRLLDASMGLSMLATVVTSPAAWAEPPPSEPEQPPITMLRLPDDPSDDDPFVQPPPTVEPTPTSTSTSTPTSTSSVPPTTEAPLVETTTTTTTSPAVAPTTTTTTAPVTTTAMVPSTTTTVPRRPRPPRGNVVDAPPPAPATTGAEWTVQPGEHFWSIAEQVLTRSWSRPPSDVETDPYWRRLVDANRHRLADPDNADLLFVGQVLGVPPPPAAPP